MKSNPTPRSKIRYGIIGFGRFADKAIAPAIKQSHNSELVAIQNRTLAKAKEAASAHGITLAFDSVADLVAHRSVDAIFIVSANSLHCAETILAAQAGKHVLCEKPMAMNVDECRRMIDACAQHGVKLMVGHMVTLSPLVRRMRELVCSGALGTVIRAESNYVYDGRLSTRSWILDRKIAGGGPIFDVGVHCLDTLRFVLDDEVVSVKGELEPKPTNERTESSAQLLLRFSRGTIASIFCSYDSPLRQSTIEIFGTEAKLSAIDFTVSGFSGELNIEKRSSLPSPEVHVERFNVPNLYLEEVCAFSLCILKNAEPPLSANNALQNQQVLDAAVNL